MRKFALVLVFASVMSISVAAQSNIRGVWQLTEITMSGKYAMSMKVTQPSLYIFTKKHYSKMYIGGDKPRPMLDDYNKATKEELYSIFVDGFDANAGSYEVAGGRLTLHTIVAKSPSDMKEGSWTTYSMKISGDTITLTPETSNTGPNRKSISFKLTRVE